MDVKRILTNQNFWSNTHFWRATAVSCLATLVLVVTSGCEKDEAESSQPKIVATTGMIADIARNVAGDRASVTSIMGEGTDPHLYTPTRTDVVQLMDADVVLYNGLMLEGKMSDVLGQLNKAGKTVVAVAEVIDTNVLLAWESDAGNSASAAKHHDPHVWMDVRKWMLAVEAVRDGMISFDSSGESGYQANTQEYLSELESLNEYARETLATIPEQQRVLVTAHDAFNYFAQAYNLEVRAIQGISTESEAGVRDINELVNYLVENKITAVFVESSVADKYVKALIEGARSHGHEVKIGGSLYSDAMGKAGTWEGTYVGMIDHNVTTITKALGGEAPDGGFRSWRATSP